MRFFVSCLLGGMISLSVASSACAQQERGEGNRHRAQSQHTGQKNSEGADLSSLLRQEGARAPVPGRERERLSQEELRQIRRDINDAGRDIYRRDRSDRVN